MKIELTEEEVKGMIQELSKLPWRDVNTVIAFLASKLDKDEAKQ